MQKNKENNNQGLSPEGVEELHRWIESEISRRNGNIGLQDSNNTLRDVSRKLQSLLSSPQPEKEGAIGSVYGQRELKNLVVSTFCEKCRQPSCICNKTSIVTSQQVSEGGITEKDFEDLIDAHMTPQAIAKDCFALAQKMVRNSILPYQNITDSWKGVGKEFNSGNAEITAQFDSQALASHRTPSISIEEAKDRVAKEDGYKDWMDYFNYYSENPERYDFDKLINEAMLLYAQHSTPVTKEGETLYRKVSVEERLPDFSEMAGERLFYIDFQDKKCVYKLGGLAPDEEDFKEIVKYWLEELPSTSAETHKK